MTRTNIINYLISKNNYKSYLEVGLDTGLNFDNVFCESKESVDPFFEKQALSQHINDILTYRMPSDDFFAQNKKKYDIIFIDGLHTEEQVGRDIINALRCLNKNGTVVIHDCLPISEICQKVPMETSIWCGSVWKGVHELIQQGVCINVVDTDYGCGVVKYTDDETVLHYPKKSDKTWKDFENNRNELMNVISVEEFKQLY